MRYYGHDFADRLQEARFEVPIIPKSDLLAQDELDRISVACELAVILCRKLTIWRR